MPNEDEAIDSVQPEVDSVQPEVPVEESPKADKNADPSITAQSLSGVWVLQASIGRGHRIMTLARQNKDVEWLVRELEIFGGSVFGRKVDPPDGFVEGGV